MINMHDHIPLDPETPTFANRGACAKNAKRTLDRLGVNRPKRGTHFQMELQADGRWRWWRIAGSDETPQAAPEAPQMTPEAAPVPTPTLKPKAAQKPVTKAWTPPTTTVTTITREAWLREAVQRLHEEVFLPHLKAQGVSTKMPKHRVACGFPVGARPSQQKGGPVGQIHDPSCSADGTVEMFVSPVLADEVKVLGTLAHEMVHMYIGVEEKHGPRFKALATAIGLEGKMTATTESEAFLVATQAMRIDMGTYPHAKLTGAALKPKNPVRQVPLFCLDDECKLTFRIAKKYIDANGGDSETQSEKSNLTCPACGGETRIKWPVDRTQ